MSSEDTMAVAVHEAGHAVIHLAEGGSFRYVTLRPRLTGRHGHVYGVRNPSPATLLAGPIAKAVWDDAEDFSLHMVEQGGCDDIEGFFELVQDEEAGAWFERTGELVLKHWDEILMVATLLERDRTVTVRQVRALLNVMRNEAA
ncbi:hypothetical protein AB0C80_18720 [Streptomyces anthocyanicus]|uniref:hypothetical protein n=1 Tax=Streptomyces anthocyanicus TaxID=68174 RepID=UPI0033F1748B